MKTIKKIQLIAFGLFCVLFTSCQKNDEYSLMSAKIDGQLVNYNVKCYALKAYYHNEDESFAYTKYTINGLDGAQGGVFMQVIDSSSSRLSFQMGDFIHPYSYYEGNTGKPYDAIDANMVITKEEADRLWGQFDMIAVNEHADTVVITEGMFELPLQTQDMLLFHP